MSLENEIKKLREAVEANTAALLQSKSVGCCSQTETPVSTTADAPAAPQPVAPVDSVPTTVPEAPAAPAAPATPPTAPAPSTPATPPTAPAPSTPAAPPAPAAPTAPEQPATPALTETEVNERLVAKATALTEAGRDGAAEVTAVIQQFGSAGIRTLDPAKWGELVAAVEAL